MLTSINPFCEIDKYGSEIVRTYFENRRGDLSPHLYAIAEEARQSLFREGKNQTIIVSGESGAGKTMNAKYIMRYLVQACSVSDDYNADNENCSHVKPTSLEQRVLATNLILEAFGNAETIRNDNSSRFGKYIQIFFDSKGMICGAKLKTYLLEKTRVVNQSGGERNFHIFHQLLATKDSQLRKDLDLDHKFKYAPLEESIDKLDPDTEQLSITIKALNIAGFSKADINSIFRVLAAILHLGDIEFVSETQDTVGIAERESLCRSSTLLQVSPHCLEKLFTKRVLNVGQESIESGVNAYMARSTRDALAKYLYHRVFDYIVSRINEGLVPEERDTNFIGVLDIYGFERFETNSFEQFCINYANEKLQNTFNRHVFAIEQKLYEDEGIDWSFIDFYDNQPCIDLIEAKCGVLDLLDEECKFPKGCDASFAAKLFSQNTSGARSNFLIQEQLGEKNRFGVKHFAYDVLYDCKGFLEKNRDTIPPEALTLLSEAKYDFLREVSRSATSTAPSKSSIGQGFKISLAALMQIISSTKCSYIRCIKPNENKEAMKIDPVFVLQQLRACGILETIRISASGYPGRWLFSDFLSRFSVLSSLNKVELFQGSDQDACMNIIKELELSQHEFQVGKTRVFMRYGILAQLEERRIFKLSSCASAIQRLVKFAFSKRSFEQFKSAIQKIQSMIGLMLRKIFARKARELGCLVVSVYSSNRAKGLLQHSRQRTVVLQQFWRQARIGHVKPLSGAVKLIARHVVRFKSAREFKAGRKDPLKIQTTVVEPTRPVNQNHALEQQVEKLELFVPTPTMKKENVHLGKQPIGRTVEKSKQDSIIEKPAQDPTLEKLMFENETLLQKCQSLQQIIDALEASNTKLFSKNQELEAKLSESVQNHPAIPPPTSLSAMTSPKSSHYQRLSLDTQMNTLNSQSFPLRGGFLQHADALVKHYSSLHNMWLARCRKRYSRDQCCILTLPGY